MPIVYFAGPLFTQGERLWNSSLADQLRGHGFEVILPQTTGNGMVTVDGSADAEAIFRRNVSDLERSDVVMAVLDQADPDSGTAWEVGYAFHLGRPIVGVRTDFRAGGDEDRSANVNLMLSRSCQELVQAAPEELDDLSGFAARVAGAIARVISR